MPPLAERDNAKRYWRSLEDLADTPAFRQFVENEFPTIAPVLLSGPTRRNFLKLMGASLGLAGLTACRWPQETIVPYAQRPKNRTPGVPVHYATAMELAGVATGLLVTSYDGRPIKIEGNDKHPYSRGKTNAIQQATVLELYDPDRSQYIVQRDGPGRRNRKWSEFVAFAGPHFAALRAKGGAGFCVLSEASASPSLMDMKARLLKAFPQAKWCEYEPLSRDNEREGARLAFGKPYRTHLHLDQADVIVSFDSDFLMTHPAAVRHAGDFAARRRAEDGTMNRLYQFESTVSVTGTMADHRYPIRSCDVAAAALHLQAELSKSVSGLAAPTGTVAAAPINAAEIARLAHDLVEHKGRSAIVVGSRQPAELHALAHVLNAALGNVGTAITYTEEPEPERPTHVAALAELRQRMQAGQVETLLILGGNPLYDAPRDEAQLYAELLPKVPTSIRLALYDDETSRACTWHVPRAHYLESWGDARAYDGTVSIVQPLIEPLYDGKTPVELLALSAGDELTRAHDIVQRTFRTQFGGGRDGEPAWHKALEDGVVANTQWADEKPALRTLAPWEPKPPAANAFEVVFTEDQRVYDGRFANNAWLQELADPITKLTWDNAALIAPADAAKLGVEQYGDTIEIVLADNIRMTVPAFIVPGHAAGSITLPLGYGRQQAGCVAAHAGVNGYALRSAAAQGWAVAHEVTRMPGHVALATTQDHQSIRSKVGDEETQERIPELIRETTLAEFRKEPHVTDKAHRPLQLWQGWNYDSGHKWGMAVDLTACIGCSACVVACQAENNIPVVGKDEVARGREMQWIRVDRYFREGIEGAGDQGNQGQTKIEVVHQPMTCHHCENAPCEQVCPFAATMHDEEGLNVQVYNRCVGTRYCSNNCPFKVRRFNWFYNHHGPKHPRGRTDLTDVEKMVFNPDVTVRSRGVMEKCSFCIQRISAAKATARIENWPAIPDGTITPACAQACPTSAIVFGDLNDPNSRVRKLHAHPRSYELLTELNLRARLHYLAKLRNPREDASAGQSETKPTT